jgi:hypothetical protein
MRAHLWLVVVCLVSRQLAVAAGERAPREPMGEIDAMSGDAAVVVDTLRAPDISKARVTVRVYSSTNLAAGTQRASLEVAQATFAAASVQIVWKVCALVACDTPISPTELVVRLVQLPDRVGDHHLGDALIDPEKRTGVLATVYVNRTMRLARELEIDHDKLLGRAIAHEIGHLLLATNTHAPSGLMRELWSHDELQRARREDWVLQPLDAAAILQRLTS